MSQSQNFGPSQPSHPPQSPPPPPPGQYGPGAPQPGGVPPYYYGPGQQSQAPKPPRVFPKWVGILTLILGLVNLISMGLPWQNVDGPTIKGQADSFTPHAQGVFPGIMVLIISIFLITTAVLILRNKTPRFQRVAPISLIVCGAIDIFMMILVLTFLNIKPYIKERWGSSALKETDHSFGIGVWLIILLGVGFIALGAFTWKMVKDNAAIPQVPGNAQLGSLSTGAPGAGSNQGANFGQGFNGSPSSPQGHPRS